MAANQSVEEIFAGLDESRIQENRASQQLLRVKGDGSPAIIVCSYGNRDYEDMLVELKDLLTANGFRIVSAAAFIARHSVFRNVASERPDMEDNRIVDDFGCKSWQLLSGITDTSAIPDINIRGSRLYRDILQVPLYPTGDDTCIDCKKCVEECPTHAIASENPIKTDESQCISCGRYIALCPVGSRNYHYPFFGKRVWSLQAQIQREKNLNFFMLSIWICVIWGLASMRKKRIVNREPGI